MASTNLKQTRYSSAVVLRSGPMSFWGHLTPKASLIPAMMGVPVTGRNGKGRERMWPAREGANVQDSVTCHTEELRALVLVDGPADCKLVPTHTDRVPEPKVSEWRHKTGRRGLARESWLWDEKTEGSVCCASGNGSHRSVVALKY